MDYLFCLSIPTIHASIWFQNAMDTMEGNTPIVYIHIYALTTNGSIGVKITQINIMNWKSIKGYEGLYEASEDGRVRSLDRIGRCGHHGTLLYKGRELKANVGTHGYKYVALSKEGKVKGFLLHRLIGYVFCDNQSDDNKEINHIDGNKLNNHANNLEWVTPSYNTKHGWNKRRNNAI